MDTSDAVRKGLLKELGYDPDAKGVDVRSKVSGALVLMGDGETTGASTVNSNTTHNRVLKPRNMLNN